MVPRFCARATASSPIELKNWLEIVVSFVSFEAASLFKFLSVKERCEHKIKRFCKEQPNNIVFLHTLSLQTRIRIYYLLTNCLT